MIRKRFGISQHARIVVDNASTDQTSTVARESWTPDCLISLRVMLEPQLGLTSAWLRGIVEAKYEVVSFIDDDNLAARDYSQE